MTTKELLSVVNRRGLSIALVDGRPVIKRPPGNKEVTDRLLAVLKIHRERIIEMLSKEGNL